MAVGIFSRFFNTRRKHSKDCKMRLFRLLHFLSKRNYFRGCWSNIQICSTKLSQLSRVPRNLINIRLLPQIFQSQRHRWLCGRVCFTTPDRSTSSAMIPSTSSRLQRFLLSWVLRTIAWGLWWPLSSTTNGSPPPSASQQALHHHSSRHASRTGNNNSIYHFGFDLPLLPTSVPNPFPQPSNYTKHIPRHLWIAVRDLADSRPGHLASLARKNSEWQFHFMGNKEKDEFMATVFANTSTLWAYNILNPEIGTAKAELWRLGVLYVYGGMYMDDDSDMGTKFDDIILPTDKFIISEEPGKFDDRCFDDVYPLSNTSMIKRFGRKSYDPPIFNNKFFVNWAIFAEPRHPLLVRSMHHGVELIKREYFGETVIKMHIMDHGGKLLMCATTHPIAHSARELVLELNSTKTNLTEVAYEVFGMRTVFDMWKEYDGNMKKWYNDFEIKDHWVKKMQKERAPYLREYIAPRPDAMEGWLVQCHGQREIYLMRNGTRHIFGNFKNFVAMGYDLDQVRIIPIPVMQLIPLGPPLPEVK